MKKAVWIALGLTTVAGALYTGAAYWSGIEIEKTLAEQHRLVENFSPVQVKSRKYTRGIFSSEEVTVLTLNQGLLKPYLGLFKQDEKLSDSVIEYHHTVRHGPLPGLFRFNLMPARAWVSTEFKMTDETKKFLAKFFGEAKPITIENQLGFGGGGRLMLNVPAFNYEEALSGVKATWKGFTATIDYAKGYESYKINAFIPLLKVDASTKGSFELSNLRYESDNQRGKTGIALGHSQVKLDAVSLILKEAIPYKLKLNELIYLFTRFKVGTFINSSGYINPSKVNLKGFSYQIQTTEKGEFIDSVAKVRFDTFHFNESEYGPLRLDASATHLHGPTLHLLDKEWAKIQPTDSEKDKDGTALRQAYYDVIVAHGLPLLKNNPAVQISELYLKVPDGEVKLKADASLAGFEDADLKDTTRLLSRVIAHADVRLPRKTVENLVIAQARNLFMVDSSVANEASAPSTEDIDNLAKSLLEIQIASWTGKGYIKEEQNHLAATLEWNTGRLYVNGKHIDFSKQDELPADEPLNPPAPKK